MQCFISIGNNDLDTRKRWAATGDYLLIILHSNF